MVLQYHTEFTLGRRGRRICRTRHGITALVALVLDLALSLVFGVIVLGLWLAGHLLVRAFQALCALLSTPFRAARRVRVRLDERRQRPPSKPSWTVFDEL